MNYDYEPNALYYFETQDGETLRARYVPYGEYGIFITEEGRVIAFDYAKNVRRAVHLDPRNPDLQVWLDSGEGTRNINQQRVREAILDQMPPKPKPTWPKGSLIELTDRRGKTAKVGARAEVMGDFHWGDKWVKVEWVDGLAGAQRSGSYYPSDFKLVWAPESS